MQAFTDEGMRKNCPHCDPQSFAFTHLLQETTKFWILCDSHPIIKGHILIIPKKHISCVGEYDNDTYSEFVSLYTKTSVFIRKTYGSISTFEHGIIGQTVFHSHIHLFPFVGSPTTIVPEGKNYLTPIDNLIEMQREFKKKGSYLFFSIGDDKWVVDISIGKPRFFRDRFAQALGSPEKGNWKTMNKNASLMKEAKRNIEELRQKWSTVNSC